MGPPFTNLFASCCTSLSFVFGAGFATPRMALGPMCHLKGWLLSCGLCCFAVLADRWQVILGEFLGRCTQCAHSATTWPQGAAPLFVWLMLQQGPASQVGPLQWIAVCSAGPVSDRCSIEALLFLAFFTMLLPVVGHKLQFTPGYVPIIDERVPDA